MSSDPNISARPESGGRCPRAGWRGCLTDNYYTGSMLGIGINSRYYPWRARTDASTRKQFEVAHVNVTVVSYLRKLNT